MKYKFLFTRDRRFVYLIPKKYWDIFEKLRNKESFDEEDEDYKTLTKNCKAISN